MPADSPQPPPLPPEQHSERLSVTFLRRRDTTIRQPHPAPTSTPSQPTPDDTPSTTAGLWATIGL